MWAPVADMEMTKKALLSAPTQGRERSWNFPKSSQIHFSLPKNSSPKQGKSPWDNFPTLIQKHWPCPIKEMSPQREKTPFWKSSIAPLFPSNNFQSAFPLTQSEYFHLEVYLKLKQMPITDAKKLNSSSILSTMLDNQELSLRSFPCSALQIYTKSSSSTELIFIFGFSFCFLSGLHWPVATWRTSTVLSLMMGLKVCLLSAVDARILLWHFSTSLSSCFCSSTRMSSSSRVYRSAQNAKRKKPRMS